MGNNSKLNKSISNHNLLTARMLQVSIQVFACLSLVFLSILALPSSFADLYISQVLYNPLKTSTGGEAVEIYNSGLFDVNLTGYTLDTTTRLQDAVFPPNAIIPSKGYYLIADAGWSDKKDDSLYPLADYEDAITLRITDGGVALVNPVGNVVDAVGWGNPDKIGLPFYMGNPASSVNKGQSLKRINFTNNNFNDFISSSPRFTNSKGETHDSRLNFVTLNLEVFGADDYIKNISIPYDFDNTMLLFPGIERNVTLSFYISSLIENNDVYVLLEKNNSNQDSSLFSLIRYNSSIISESREGYYLYSSNIVLDYFLEPGVYSVSIVLNTSSAEYIKTKYFSILPLLAFNLEFDSINCLYLGQVSCNISSHNETDFSKTPMIKNIGNLPLDFKIYANDFNDGSNSIDINNVKLSIGNLQNISLSNEPMLYRTNISPGPSAFLPFSLHMQLPSNIISGRYSTKLVFMGVTHEG
jgi:hypothetical protein